ncbi:MAG: hypothetical protein QNJ46_22895 [Leptolyngbyaceae cyanobacterium MO_188.B28]|nr:hypothetical protein [Leptolyngbyaceae cyanobacterium MO_188.B28]
MTKSASEENAIGASTQYVDGMRSALGSFAPITLQPTEELGKLAKEVLDDPIALQKLGDRVFELLEREIRSQQERSGASGRRLS